MYEIDLNCDMGEGMDNDVMLMPYISSANIACGLHAGNESMMKQTIENALKYGVAIGAHPGFADKINFGRKEWVLPATEIFDLVTSQVQSLQKLAVASGASLHHVKPHGALYNMSAKDPQLAQAIARAVYAVDAKLVLFGLSGSCSIGEAEKIGLKTASEVFADRTYQHDGSLTPRSQPNALINTTEQSLQQVLQMILKKTVNSTGNQTIPIIAETLCIHGDGPNAVSFAKAIRQTLKQYSISIQSVNT